MITNNLTIKIGPTEIIQFNSLSTTLLLFNYTTITKKVFDILWPASEDVENKTEEKIWENSENFMDINKDGNYT